MIWLIVIGVIGFCSGWAGCAMFASGKIIDLQFEIQELKYKESLSMAEQQLLGYKHCNEGFDLESLVDSMGLRLEEWQILKRDFPLSHLTEDEKVDIEEWLEQTYETE